MTSDEFLKSQPVEGRLGLSFCDYEDQSQNTAVADLEWSTNLPLAHSFQTIMTFFAVAEGGRHLPPYHHLLSEA